MDRVKVCARSPVVRDVWTYVCVSFPMGIKVDFTVGTDSSGDSTTISKDNDSPTHSVTIGRVSVVVF